MIDLRHGDCREVLRDLPDASVHCCVTDPPYGLEFMGKEWDKFHGSGSKWSRKVATGKDWNGRERARPGRLYMRSSHDTCGRCGKQSHEHDDSSCDAKYERVTHAPTQMRAYGDWCEEWAREVLRVLKPGGYLVAFGGTRTSHRMACAIEDAGFEIRDTLMYLYGCGFPKSHNVNKALNGSVCQCSPSDNPMCSVREAARDAGGLVQASEAPDVLASVQWSTAGSRVGEARSQGAGSNHPGGQVAADCRDPGGAQSSLEGWCDLQAGEGQLSGGAVGEMPGRSADNEDGERLHHGAPPSHGADGGPTVAADGMRASHRPQPAQQRAQQPRTVAQQSDAQAGGAWSRCERCSKPIVSDGLGTALKPAYEPIILARKPLAGTVAQNVLAHGTGAINVDACRVPHGGDGSWGNGRSDGSCWSPGRTNGGSEPEGARHDAGRWPANVLHDGSDEVEAAFAAFGSSTSTAQPRHNDTANKNGASMNSGSPNGTVTYGHADIGSASRFFYSAKATAADRAGSRHPTVKPVELMRWLVRLVCPPGGTCLDPFAGSGTTGEAAMLCGFDAVLIEQDTQHVADIRHRMHRWAGEDMPLFASPPPASDDAYDRDMRDLFAEAAP